MLSVVQGKQIRRPTKMSPGLQVGSRILPISCQQHTVQLPYLCYFDFCRLIASQGRDSCYACDKASSVLPATSHLQ